ncbi:MAG: hypothetical protein A2622_03225 [Bdellovibrionales bacterium RIFCSPHIGHO2_01_FULL_40_29]|nr:MAG: hypothetical protein A2622_03225 [Bdellovibrionales bacterium RIFCSPHIGHO2_01_FULL_40_29]OFZ34084.1 MAG: hypothetical protein A3D17_03645 [Bdellovibrionales bacterium RIFCSPHIGHO2_02_FULL_40_15]
MIGFKSGQKFERMKGSRPFRFLFPIFASLIFLGPYLVSLFFLDNSSTLNSTELLWALKNSVIQSGAAALISVSFGFFLSFGLLNFSGATQSVLGRIVLVPQVLPTLFSILISFSLLNPFPMGHIGVIFIFTLVNLGLSTYFMAHAIRSQVGNLALVSDVMGIKKSSFIFRILLPLIKSDLKVNFFFVFLFCLASLSVPLVAGGGKGTNLEVLIYEKIFIEQAWNSAAMMMIFQTGLIFCISYFFLNRRGASPQPFVSHPFLKSKVSALALLIYIISYGYGYISRLLESFSDFEDLVPYGVDILEATGQSLLIGIVTLGICFVFLYGWIVYFVEKQRHHFVIHLMSISTVLVGFSLYILFSQTVQMDYIKLPLAFLILFVPALFRFIFEDKLAQIKGQILAAKVHSISTTRIVFQIILHQFPNALLTSASLLLIWTLSDFAISRAAGAQVKTLGLLSVNFLNSYRLNSAYLLSFYILIFWGVLSALFYFFIKGIYGVDRKR